MILEVCCGNLESVHAAVKGGAQRVELCSHLELDGLTPLWEELREARSLYPALKIHALIRPREGDFCYCPEEVAQMEADIETALELGADGIVIGALDEKGDVDAEVMKELVAQVNGRASLTFHRAFDAAQEGTDMLRELQRRAHLTILPGGGINANNARRILDLSGCRELHASASTTLMGRKVTDAKKVADILSVTQDL